MTRRRLIRIFLAILALAGVTRLSALPLDAPGSITIDSSRLTEVRKLDAAWRFTPRDEPHCAALSLDDSPWRLVRPGTDAKLADAGIADEGEGIGCGRLRLHVLNAAGPLALTLSVRDATQYAVFANGTQIAASSGYAGRSKFYDNAIQVKLPQVPDILLAVRFVYPEKVVIHYLPLEQVEIGQAEVMGYKVDLERYRTFEGTWLAYLVLAAVYLGTVPICLSLLLAQRDHSEYVWLAVFYALQSLIFTLSAAVGTGWMTGGSWVQMVLAVLGILDDIVFLEFVAVLANARRGVLLRLVQGLQVLAPVVTLFGTGHLIETTYIVITIPYLILTVYLLGRAYRQGNRECGLLLVPAVFIPLSELVAEAQSTFPQWFGPIWTGHLRGVGLTAYQIGSMVFLAALMAVVLYRFIRVSKKEEIAAAELDAAHKVQQLLIPPRLPDTPGFLVDSAYQPAREVGGDFFVLLPAHGEAGASLLAIVGDVSGTGLQAAMVVSTIIGGLRMGISRRPSEVLALLNGVLVGHVSGFATCCVVLVEQNGHMHVANAGNPSPYWNGEELATPPGLPLGLIEDVTYEEISHTLTKGDCLTFVSDGVIEASRSHGELFGFERAQAVSMRTAAEIASAAMDFAAGSPQADDITVVTLSYLGV